MSKEKEQREKEAEADELETKYLTASTLVCDKPCLLYFVSASSQAGEANISYLRDGLTVADRIKLELAMATYTTTPISFNPPMRFKQGLYFEFNFAGHTATVRYKSDY